MADISKRFEKLVVSTYHKLYQSDQILPVKTHQGILVGKVLIESDGYLKNLWIDQCLIYQNINLNGSAIKIANLLNRRDRSSCDRIYQADQEYGRWFEDCNRLKSYRDKLNKLEDYFRADIVQARYQESKIRLDLAKKTITGLCRDL